MTTIAATAWPSNATIATIMWSMSRAPGRVLRSDENSLTMAVALRAGERPLPKPGGLMMLEWGTDAGLHERPIALDRYKAGLLHLAPAGHARSVQRRRFFRAPISLTLRISDGKNIYDGLAVDLSEGGARIRVAGAVLPQATQVIVTIHHDGVRHDIPGVVVRRILKGKRSELGVQFDPTPAATADMIRQQVFEAQVAHRRFGQGTR